MIDNKGRLFGKVSIVDLFVLAVVIVAAVFMYRNMGVAAITTSAKGDSVVISFHAEQAPDCVADYLKVGDRVMDEERGVEMGRITSFKTAEGYDFFPDENGQLVKSAKYGFCSVEIEAEVKAVLYENGVIIDGNKYGVSHSMTIYAGPTMIYARISGIKKGA